MGLISATLIALLFLLFTLAIIWHILTSPLFWLFVFTMALAYLLTETLK